MTTTKVIDAWLVSDLMMQSVENQFRTSAALEKQIELLTDNGSCYTAAKARSFAKLLGLNRLQLRGPVSNVTK